MVNKKIKTLLVTGGGGFIGSNMIQYLLNNTSYHIVGVDTFENGENNREFIESLSATNERFTLINENFINTNLSNVEIVFHFAATPRVSYSVEEPILTNENNVTNTLLLLENCVKNKVKRFVFSSSSSVYGDVENFPTDENEKVDPISPYALQKLTIEKYCKLYSQLYGLDTVSLRYFNVYGPNQYADNAYATVICAWIKSFIENESIRLDGNGEQSRDFSYVDDVCQANYLVGFYNDNLKGEIYNVAHNSNTTLNTLIELIKSINPTWNSSINREDSRVGDVFKTHANINKIRKLNFHPKTYIKEGIELTYSWYQSILNKK